MPAHDSSELRRDHGVEDEDHIYAGPSATHTRLTETDPLAGLKELARQVKAAGVRSVAGDVQRQ